jgi:uncharacterized membrane protein YagU involved in acid resistance
MPTKELIQDAALAGVAGYLATTVMEQFNMRAYPLEPPDDREREESVRPSPPFQLAAENLSERVMGVELDEDRAKKAGMAFHYLAGLSWTPVYLLLRRKLGWSPVASGLVSGASMSLLLDEIVTPAIGASAPNDRYPASTHVRAAAAHLVFGLTVAGVVETGWKLMGRR